MDISRFTAQEPSRRSAFSLVEVTIAIGIASFVFVVIFSLIPIGLSSFRQSMNTNIGAQIAQHVINDAIETDFDSLNADDLGVAISGSNATAIKGYRFFDDQGVEVIPVSQSASSPATAPNGLAPAEKSKISYWVNTRVMPATAVPESGATASVNDSLATVTVQVAYNPASRKLAFEAGTSNDLYKPLRNLWNGAYATATANEVVPIKSYSALVSRSK